MQPKYPFASYIIKFVSIASYKNIIRSENAENIVIYTITLFIYHHILGNTPQVPWQGSCTGLAYT